MNSVFLVQLLLRVVFVTSVLCAFYRSVYFPPTGCIKNGGRDKEDSWHFSGDVRLDIKATRNYGVGVNNFFLLKYCVQSKSYQKPFPVLTCSTVKE